MMVMTFPVGYNPQLDRLLEEGIIGFTKRVCMKRVSRDQWVEADLADCRGAMYGPPHTAANALVVLFISKM